MLTRMLSLGLLLVAVGCHVQSTSRSVIVGGGVHKRTGPAFDEAFPDPSILITTEDPDRLRAKLGNAILPSTQEHHDRLLELLGSVDSINPAHLQLLVEAVYLPQDGGVLTVVNEQRIHFPLRGKGEFAPVADRLLLEGAKKLEDLDAFSAGRLLGRTHSDGTLSELADLFLEKVDDGSDQALQDLVRGFGGSPALRPMLVDFMAPRDLLTGERHWTALEALPFDDGKLAVIEACALRMEQCTPADLVRYGKLMSFDSGRVSAIAAVAPRVGKLEGTDLVPLLGAFSFDEGRHQSLEKLIASAEVKSTHVELNEIVRTCSFDETRGKLVGLMAPRLGGSPTSATLREILAAFSFDSGRLKALERLAPSLGGIDSREHREVLAVFSFDSNRKEAKKILSRSLER